MKKILSILSAMFLLAGCKHLEFPEVPLYVVDLTNGVCAHYEFLDRKRLTVKHIEDLDLLPGGPCDGLVGFDHSTYNLKVKPWIRDSISEAEQCLNPKP